MPLRMPGINNKCPWMYNSAPGLWFFEGGFVVRTEGFLFFVLFRRGAGWGDVGRKISLIHTSPQLQSVESPSSQSTVQRASSVSFWVVFLCVVSRAGLLVGRISSGAFGGGGGGGGCTIPILNRHVRLALRQGGKTFSPNGAFLGLGLAGSLSPPFRVQASC
jgi:hypothetical protein